MAAEYDLVIIGGGTGGYVAAIRASQLGLKTAIVEKEKLGGTCLHKGCIPSKALLRSAEMYDQVKQAANFGIETGSPTVNFFKVQERKNAIVETLHRGVQGLMQKGKIDVYQGFGRILGPSIFSPSAGTVSVEMTDGRDNEMLVPKQVLIATGSQPKVLTGLETDGDRILNSDDALGMDTLPESLIIIGGGAIGVEWASMMADFEVKVTVLEHADRILPTEDEEVSKEMTRSLKRKNVQVITGAKVTPDTIDKGSQVEVKAEVDGETRAFEVEKVLVSVGRTANTSNLGLANTEIVINERKEIEVNGYYQTKESHIYAIGDVIGGPQLAHVASREGMIAVEHMAGLEPDKLNYSHIPVCVYSNPESARIGLTERQAVEQGYQIKIGKIPFKATGKSLILGKTDGFVKIVANKENNDLLGVHMVGPHVTDMISEAGLAAVLDATPWEIAASIHPHPSLAEAIGEAALAVDGIQIHG